MMVKLMSQDMHDHQNEAPADSSEEPTLRRSGREKQPPEYYGLWIRVNVVDQKPKAISYHVSLSSTLVPPSISSLAMSINISFLSSKEECTPPSVVCTHTHHHNYLAVDNEQYIDGCLARLLDKLTS